MANRCSICKVKTGRLIPTHLNLDENGSYDDTDDTGKPFICVGCAQWIMVRCAIDEPGVMDTVEKTELDLNKASEGAWRFLRAVLRESTFGDLFRLSIVQDDNGFHISLKGRRDG